MRKILTRNPTAVSTALTRFEVHGLHGSRTMDVRLADNKLILVGENGAGKSTFVNLIYYFLTKQWGRLQEFHFSRICAHFGDEKLELVPDDLEHHMNVRRQLHRLFRASRDLRTDSHASAHVLKSLMELPFPDEADTDSEYFERFSREFHLPPGMVRGVLQEYSKEARAKVTHVSSLEQAVNAKELGQFLYLPTYRRIEQDLRSIFRGADIGAELKRFRERHGRRESAPFIELVEFGMEDVELTIANRMSQIKENVRKGLDSLTGTYLRDVIRGVHENVDVTSVGELDSDTLDSVFTRIDEATLPAQDKARLKAKVAAISSSGDIPEGDKVIAHFLLKLIAFHNEQQANERTVRDFVALCNRYLAGKDMVYDNARYTIVLRQAEEVSQSETTLPMQALSSGEKQIVSLFSHLYLSGEKRFFVIIDEPELSLSVPWQRLFLPDILGTGLCTGMVAVTHSPFVWDNPLEEFVRPLGQFTTHAH